MAAYALTIFLGAFLLFQVQPLIGKFILPWFGGSSSVWTTCMLFFQWLLLGGYLYSHLTSTHLKPRTQAAVHGVLLFAALLFLPVTPDAAWKPSPGDDPTFRILALLLASVGLPYFILATTGPLIQRWFSLANPEGNPYRLYALSNIGSLLALLSFPFVFEPSLTRGAQANFWSGGMILFALSCGWCALKQWDVAPALTSNPQSSANVNTNSEEQDSQSPTPPSLGVKLFWLALPATASVALLATTNKMCIDVAVIPFLWILPLCLYLLSFILCFDHPRWYMPWHMRGLWGTAMFIGIALSTVMLKQDYEGYSMPKQIGIFSGTLFAACMVCHGELFRLRPPANRLTGYYLMIAAGGAIGGLLVAIVAPLVFKGYFEYHTALMALAVLTLLAYFQDKNFFLNHGALKWGWISLLIIPHALGWVLLENVFYIRSGAVERSRNFYGALTVYEYDADYPESRRYLLMHGGITHGMQLLDSFYTTEPITYYGKGSGIELALHAYPQKEDRHIGVVGLGTGTMAAHGKAGDRMRFYEIDPAVTDLAKNLFTYLADSEAEIEVIMGDARLAMENEPPQAFDLLALDAFSSDAIPVHLLTREAMAVYRRHLKPNGVLAIHISNRHLNLQPVVAALAEDMGWQSIEIENWGDEEIWAYYSDWMIVTQNEAVLTNEDILFALFADEVTEDPEKQSAPPKKARIWTDDYSALIDAFNSGED